MARITSCLNLMCTSHSTQMQVVLGIIENSHQNLPKTGLFGFIMFNNKCTMHCWGEQQLLDCRSPQTRLVFSLIILKSTHIMPQFIHNFHQLKTNLVYLNTLFGRGLVRKCLVFIGTPYMDISYLYTPTSSGPYSFHSLSIY